MVTFKLRYFGLVKPHRLPFVSFVFEPIFLNEKFNVFIFGIDLFKNFHAQNFRRIL